MREVPLPLADHLLAHPTAVSELLAEHVDDGCGHCRACPIGGQRGFQTWPCTIHVAALAAQRRRRQERGTDARRGRLDQSQ